MGFPAVHWIEFGTPPSTPIPPVYPGFPACQWLSVFAPKIVIPIPLADDLSAAIKALFLASPGLMTVAPGGIFNGMASDGADPATPYIVFKIASDPTEYLSNSSRWGDTRIRFEGIASTASAANLVARVIVATFGGDHGIDGVRLEFEDGFTTSFVLDDRSQSASPVRGKNNVRIYRSYACYSTKVRQGNF